MQRILLTRHLLNWPSHVSAVVPVAHLPTASKPLRHIGVADHDSLSIILNPRALKECGYFGALTSRGWDLRPQESFPPVCAELVNVSTQPERMDSSSQTSMIPSATLSTQTVPDEHRPSTSGCPPPELQMEVDPDDEFHQEVRQYDTTPATSDTKDSRPIKTRRRGRRGGRPRCQVDGHWYQFPVPCDNQNCDHPRHCRKCTAHHQAPFPCDRYRILETSSGGGV